MYKILKEFSDDKNKKLFVFGAGKTALDVTKAFSMFGIYIDAYFDNQLREGGYLNGFKIMPLDVLRQTRPVDCIVVIASVYEYEITKQLNEYGLGKRIIYRRDIAVNKNTEYDVLEFPVVEEPEVSVLVTAYNQWNYTYNCLKSLLENGNICKYEVILGDDCSTDETRRLEKYVKNVKVVHHTQNKQYLGNVNSIASMAKGKYLMLLANDTLLTQRGYIDRLINTMNIDKNIGGVSGKFWVPASGRYDMPRNYQNGSVGVPLEYDGFENVRCVEYLWPVGTLYRKEVWEKVSGFDSYFLPVYWEDCDLHLRMIKAGYSMVFDPDIEMIHYGGGSYNISVNTFERYENNKVKFEKRWNDYISNFGEERCAYLEKVYTR